MLLLKVVVFGWVFALDGIIHKIVVHYEVYLDWRWVDEVEAASVYITIWPNGHMPVYAGLPL